MNLYTDFWKRTIRQVINKVDPVKPAEFEIRVDELQSIGERNISGYNGSLVCWAGKVEQYKDSAVFRSLKSYIETSTQVRTSLPGDLRLKIHGNNTLQVVYFPITLESVIKKYESIPVERKERELYKWRLIKEFQDDWKRYESDELSFAEFFDTINFKNLVYLNAVSTLKTVARGNPEELERIMLMLFDENTDLQQRIHNYIAEFEEAYAKVDTKGWKPSQDERTIATLLTFRYPGKYTFFKDSFYTKLCKALGIKPYPTREKLVHYYKLVDDLLTNQLPNHPDVIDLKISMLDESMFHDVKHNILAQDILYLTLDSNEESEVEESGEEVSEPEELYSKPNNNDMHSLNQILFGPPGTGKTYNTIDKALQIVDGDFYRKNKSNRKELTERFKALLINDWNTTSGQIAFVTFHQSMSYEDFIEGIKPDLSGGDRDLNYIIEPGIFKKICKLANTRLGSEDNFEIVYDNLLQEIEDNNNSLVLKTAKRQKEFTIYENSKGNIRFHANTDKAYEGVIRKDFIATYLQTGELLDWPSYTRAVGDYIKSKYDYIRGTASEDKNYVIIIDEINRGNISQIFGELITLIEDDKRQGNPEELTVTLPYSKKPFSVPSNLYIIGTMNTADRSVEALDSALRRRFVFEHKPPQPGLLKPMEEVDIDLSSLLVHINSRIEKLLSKDYQIGHAYLIQVKTLNDLRIAFHSKILPLLQEYFFGDLARVGLVVGEVFIKDPKIDTPVNLMTVQGYDSGDLNDVKAYHVQDIMQWDESTFIKNIKAIYGE